MAFLIKLKKKAGAGAKGRVLKPEKAVVKKVDFGGDSGDESDQDKKFISTFDPDQKPKKQHLVITPTELRKRPKREENTNNTTESTYSTGDQSNDDHIRQSLLRGENTSSLTIIPGESDFDADYTEVPVEEFGAALLRGMGWKGDRRKADNLAYQKRQQGPVLGIGAKPIAADLAKDVMGGKISVPVKRRGEKKEVTDKEESI